MTKCRGHNVKWIGYREDGLNLHLCMDCGAVLVSPLKNFIDQHIDIDSVKNF